MGMGVDKLYIYPTSGPSQNHAVNFTLLCDLHTKWAKWVRSELVVFCRVETDWLTDWLQLNCVFVHLCYGSPLKVILDHSVFVLREIEI